jgi:hypothetical protein
MLDTTIIEQIRALVLSGSDVPAIVGYLQQHSGKQRMNAFEIIRYFMEAFGLSLSEVRPLEGAACLGNSAYSNAEINASLLPMIREKLRRA